VPVVEDIADVADTPLLVGIGASVSAGASATAEARVGLTIPFARRFGAELRLSGGVDSSWDLSAIAPTGAGTLGVRWSLPFGFELAAGAGLGWRDGPAPVVTAAVAWRPNAPWRVEVGADVLRPSVVFGADALVSLAPRAPVSVAPAAPSSAGRVWVPHPVCDWVPADEAEALLAALGPEVANQAPHVHAADEAAAPSSALGGVVIVAAPGDTLAVGAITVDTGGDGTAVIASAEGPVVIDVSGGGRAARIEGEVSGGYTVWLRAPLPADVVLIGGAVDAAALTPLVALRGRHRYEIVARWLAGEDPLAARARAEAVSAWLIREGLPPSAVVRLATEAGADRAVTVRSVGP
jgi:hypothetical protein